MKKAAAKKTRSVFRPEQSHRARSSAPASQFALPAKRAYWIPDVMHADLALGEAKKFATPAQRKTIAAAIAKAFPSLKDKAAKLR